MGAWLPVSAFAAIGFEHSIANMFFIPMGMAREWYSNDPDGSVVHQIKGLRSAQISRHRGEQKGVNCQAARSRWIFVQNAVCCSAQLTAAHAHTLLLAAPRRTLPLPPPLKRTVGAPVTISTFLNANILPVTLGNIVGGGWPRNTACMRLRCTQLGPWTA